MSLKIHLQQQLFPKNLEFEAEFAAPITGMFGPTGVGKSTVLNAIAGIRHHDFCQISFDEEAWCDTEKSIFVRPQQRQLAYVMQEIALFPNLTVQGNIEFSRRSKARGLKLDAVELSNLTQQLGLAKFLPQTINKLSGGQKQAVALARALYSKPRLLLLDEPFNGLDDESAHQAIQLVSEIVKQEKIQTIVVSHHQSELEALVNETFVLK